MPTSGFDYYPMPRGRAPGRRRPKAKAFKGSKAAKRAARAARR